MIWAAVAAVNLFIAAIMILTPAMSRADTPLGVRVPATHVEHSVVVSAVQTYRRATLAIAVILVLAGGVVTLVLDTSQAAAVGLGIMPLVLVALSLTAMVHARRAIVDAKQAGGWYRDTTSVEPTTSIEASEVRPRARWWLHGVGVGLTIAALVAGYLLIDRFPDPYPTHWDASGRVDRATTRTPLAVATLPLIVLASQGIVAALAIVLARQPVLIHAAGSLASRERSRRLRDRTLDALGGASLASGVLLWAIQGAAWGWWTGRVLPWVVGAILVLALAGCLLLVLPKRGQDSSGPPDVDHPDDDHLYRWGLFYVNPDDPNLMVEKRFGYGMDLNYGHPVGRVIGAGLLTLIGGTIVVLIWGIVAPG